MKKFARSLGALSVAVAFGAGSALLAPAAGAQSLPTGSLGSVAPEQCGDQVLTPSTLKDAGWATPGDETPAKIAENPVVNDKVGASALTFPVASPAVGTSIYKNAGRMPLKDLLDKNGALQMKFDYVVNGQAPALQIRLHEASLADSEENAAGYDLGFASITWTPASGDNTWQTTDSAESEEFWVTRALADGDNVVTRGTRMSLKEIIKLNPNAVVTDYGVQLTKENGATNVAVDNFQFGCLTTKFELDPKNEPAGSLENIFGSVTDIFSS